MTSSGQHFSANKNKHIDVYLSMLNLQQATAICSEDTDVYIFVMVLDFRGTIGVPLFHKCSNKNQTQRTDVT